MPEVVDDTRFISRKAPDLGLQRAIDSLGPGDTRTRALVRARTRALVRALLLPASDLNYIVGNRVKAPNHIVTHGAGTKAADDFPGRIPADRVDLLDELIRIETDNWVMWQERARNLTPPSVSR